MENLCTVTFPEHLTVLSPRGKDKNGTKTGGEPMEHPVIWKDVPLEKALKLARTSDATIKDADGKVIAKPRVKITDDREAAGAKRISALEEQVAALTGAAEAAGAKKVTKKG